MPMMLENTMSMEMDEDLFGEGADVMGPDVMGTDVMGTLMPMRAQNKHLRQRLDDMRSRGCCQTIAWSRTGTIASISSDGTRLQLRQLRAHPKDGSWDLSEPTTSTHVQGTPSNPLVHLEWAATNSPELAVFDSVGRVMLFSFALALNHPFVLRNWDADPIDTLNAAVGCYCLPVPPPSPQKPFNILHGPAVKTNTGYQYTSSFVHLNTVSHPHPSKTALFSVTAGGMLRMFWGQSNNTYQETTKELESVHSSEDLITHAAITADKSNLLIAVATSSKRLRLHKVDIQWGNTNPQGDKPATTPQIPRLNPSLHNKQLATTSWTQSGPSSMSADPSMTELSSLTVLPSSLDSSGSNTAPAVVVAIRSSLPGPGVFGDGQSVLDRWEVVEQRETLHPAFEQLGSRRNSISSNELPMVTKLRKLEPIVLPKILIRLQTMHFGRTLILNYSDGSVEYRNRFTFEELYVEEDLNHVAHLRQVGWAFPEGTSCYQVAYSPTFGSMIVIGDDAKPKWVKMQYTKGDIGETMQDPTYGACIAGLTVTAASAMWYQSNVDDLLALASSYTHKKRFNMDWVGDLVRILKVQVDYTDVDQPHDNLIRNTVLQGCLSIVHSTGFRGRLKKQSFGGKMAMINLNVRNVNLLITFALNSPPPLRERTNPLDEDEVVVILSDCARWALDLLAWLADCLFELMHDEYFMKLVEQQKSPDMMQYLMGRNDISLHLVLCSSSRSLLSALCRRMGNVESISNKAHEHYQQQRASGTARSSNLQLQEAYAKMKRTTSSAMINIKAMEKLLHTFATDIKQTYADFLPKLMKNQPNPPQGKEIDGRVRSAQSQCELAMLSCSPPPVPFFTVIRKFFETDLRAFRNEVDAAGLYFANYDILEVQDDDSSLAAKGTRGTHVDVFKRVELGPTPRQGKQWRRCTRCSAVMEDVPGQRSNLAGLTFLLNQQRKCSCGGFWTLLPPGKLVL